MSGNVMSGGAMTARAMVDQLDRTGSCARPVRIVTFREGHPDEDRVMLLPCKDRRSAVCPACSHTYKGDAWQVVATGLQGGKGVPVEVGTHPRVFVTLTAPSFGPVHTRSSHGSGNQFCRRARAIRCVHGISTECLVSHHEGDPLLGQPICPRCFDYAGAVLWNAHVAVLWQRTAKRVLRYLERAGDGGGDGLRLSYVKAAEFQRRGLVHLHVVVRVDGIEGPGDPPPAWATPDLVIEALTAVVPEVSTSVPGHGTRGPDAIGWGRQMVATVLAGGGPAGTVTTEEPVAGRPLAGEQPAAAPLESMPPAGGEEEDNRHMAVAAYVAKYATKTADTTGALAYRIRRPSDIVHLRINGHQRRLVETAWTLGGDLDLAELRLRRCAHSFGYRGHVVTKSSLYSTTFSALRSARAEYRARTGDPRMERGDDAHFGFAGRGYDDPSVGMLAFHLAQLAITGPDTSSNLKDGS